MIKKFNKSAHTAISQIKKQNYFASLQQYVGDILLVGINYDKKSKIHTCSIDRITKSNTKEGESAVLNTQQQRVLEYCERQSRTALEIFNHLSISKQAKHYDLYIHYLVENGFWVDVTPESKRNKKYLKN